MKRGFEWALALFVGIGLVVQADEFFQLSSVQDGVGRMSTNTVMLNSMEWRHVSAGAQPGGIQTGTYGEWRNHAGFLQAAWIRCPALDTDGDGAPDEIDRDNDADRLEDEDEVTGAAFGGLAYTDPNDADSDDDSSSDYHELVAGTNPTNLDSVFEIVDLEVESGAAAVSWTAHGNNERIYVVRAVDDSYSAIPADVVWSNTVAGGVAPWYETTQTINDVTTTARFYAVEVIRP